MSTEAATRALPPPKIAQIALCSADLPQTVRLYTEVFGFASAGGIVIWGEWLARIQALGDDAAATLWWLVGRQDLLQVEVFAHTLPPLRPLPADWRPSDHGWVRWGLTVPDFDAALGRLRAFGVDTLTEPIEHEGLRRVCFRDPEVGIVVEILEDGAALPGGVRPRHYDLVPVVVYAAVSVRDLDRARAFFVETIGLVEDDTALHTPEMEALWGLPGAKRESFVVRGGDVYVEVLRYDEPAGRPQPADHLLSDQGIMNIAAGYRDRPHALALLESVAANGYTVNAEMPGPAAGGTYVTDDQGNSFEILCAPREFDAGFGFMPQPAILRPHAWPQPAAGPAPATTE